jgi:TRAP-type C4-dicarboxylate transport system substrate-binding protein
MSTFAKSAPLMDMPFLFRDLNHWHKVLDSDALKPIANEVAKRADVMILGYAGGGTRNLIVNKPVRNMQELKGLSIRVMGAPVQTKMFQAITTSPTVIAYTEIYNAIQTGVIQAAENEAAGLEQMKFYEVGPHISLTRHAITVRPVCFSGKTFRRLPKDLQDAIVRAGREAGAYGRNLESSEDQARLQRLEKEGKLKTHVFADRDQLLRLAEPVKQMYAKEVGAEDVLARINAIK